MSGPTTPVSKKSPTRSVYDFSPGPSSIPKLSIWDQKHDSDDELSTGATIRSGNSAEGWTRLSKTMIAYDENKIQDCKEDMDTLLVFAGLFSAVLTAFNVESYKVLQPDMSQTTVLLLTQMSLQLNSFAISSGFVNSTNPALIDFPTFQASPSVVRINILWFCSLVCSLVTASLAMLIKQWLREYQSQENISPRSRARIRYWRNEGLVQFRVLELAALLPLLLQLALILFFGGLCLFLQDLHPAVGWVVTILIIVWFVLYVTTTIAPAFSSRCPYKTPLFKESLRFVQHKVYSWKERSTSSSQPTLRDERFLRNDQSLDVPTLVAADAALLDDEFLNKTIRDCLADANGEDVERCVRQIITNRSGSTPSDPDHLSSVTVPQLQRLSSTARSAIVHILLDAMDHEIDRKAREKKKLEWMPWLLGSFLCVGSALLPVYPSIGSSKDGMVADMNRAGEMVIKLLSQTEMVAHGMLEVLAFSRHSRLPSGFNIPQITAHDVMTNLIAGTRACLAAKRVDPTHLCQVVLYLATHFHDENLREEWYTLNKLLGEITVAITEKSQATADYAVQAGHTARFCLDYSRKLNFKHRGVVGSDLLETLNSLVNARKSPP